MNKLIVGLGNPGKKYKNTRHNVGFIVLDYLADQWCAKTFSASRHADALTAEPMVASKKVGLVKPQTFMNKSGLAVHALSDYFDVKPANILVIHDDIALPIGTLRLSQNSSAGGHNGVQSVINALGTNHFVRLRIGIDSRKPKDEQVEKNDTRAHVLGQFTNNQKQVIAEQYPDIQTAVEMWIKDGAEPAMNLVNGQ